MSTLIYYDQMMGKVLMRHTIEKHGSSLANCYPDESVMQDATTNQSEMSGV
jgi:hypothetical protein